MADNNQKNAKMLDDLKKLGQEIDEANSAFLSKTDSLIGNIKKDLKDADQKFKEDEKELKNEEKKAINEMDRIVLDFLSESSDSGDF